jgi:autotransporter-associated beta strand protein
MRRRDIAVIGCLPSVFFLAVASNTGAQTYNPTADFERGWTTDSNPNGVWSYGYSSGFTDPITLYDQTVQDGYDSPNEQLWLSPPVDIGYSPAVEFNNGPAFDDGNVDALTDELLLVAGIGGQYADLIFTAPGSGMYTVAGSFRGDQYNIGVVAAVVANGSVVFNSSVTAEGQIVPFNAEVSLKTGNTIVFSVGPDGGLQNTGFSATITNTKVVSPLTFDASGANPGAPTDGNGNWDTTTGANWSNGSADSTWANGSTAFFGYGGAAGTVTIDDPSGAVTVSGITFNNTPGSDYTITGEAINLSGVTPTITVASGQSPTIRSSLSGGSGLTVAGPGTLNLTGNNSNLGGTIVVSSGMLVVGNSDAIPTASPLTIGTATTHAQVHLVSQIGIVAVPSLTIYSGSTLDVSNNTLIIDYGSTADPISAIQSYLTIGYAGGNWDGYYIDSSTAASLNRSQGVLLYGLGYADGADGITSVPSGEIEITLTLAGDAKLQGNVVFGDFQLLAQYFGQNNTSWDEGDFSYSRTTNFGDFQLLAQDFGDTSGGLSASEMASLNSFAATFDDALIPNPDGVGFSIVSVPEPAVAGLLGLGGLGILLRRCPRSAQVLKSADSSCNSAAI